jgi:hypothetical protein
MCVVPFDRLRNGLEHEVKRRGNKFRWSGFYIWRKMGEVDMSVVLRASRSGMPRDAAGISIKPETVDMASDMPSICLSAY